MLDARGFGVTRLTPNRDGLYLPEAIAAAVRPDTGLVSIETAHHEIGTIQPIADIAALVAPRGIIFHTDAAQALGKIALPVAPNVDLMSLSAHKIYGPKGIGALYVRRRPGLTLTPLFAGGGQQRGLRPGTIPTPLAVGFGAACRLAAGRMADDALRLGRLRDRLLDGLAASIPGLIVNGTMHPRLAHNLNLRLPRIAAADLIHRLRDVVAISSGSACASAVIAPSPSLLALGVSEVDALASIRIGLGRATTMAEIDTAISAITETWSGLTSSPRAA
jgi:cysteine desulfurase